MKSVISDTASVSVVGVAGHMCGVFTASSVKLDGMLAWSSISGWQHARRERYACDGRQFENFSEAASGRTHFAVLVDACCPSSVVSAASCFSSGRVVVTKGGEEAIPTDDAIIDAPPADDAAPRRMFRAWPGLT